LTDTLVSVHQVDARPSVFARVNGTVIDVYITVMTRIPRLTLARVTIYTVCAHSTVLTWVRTALIDINVTTFASVTWPAVAYKLVETVLAAQCIQGTWVTGAFVDIGQTTRSIVTARTFTTPTSHQVYASATIGTRAACTFIHVHLAM